MEDRFLHEALQEALRRRDQLQYEMALLQKKMEDVEELIRLAERIFAEQKPGGAKSPPPSYVDSSEAAPQTPPQGRKRSPTPPARIADLAHEEMLALGRPMTRGELVSALEARGVELVAQDKAKNVGTILWRMSDRFENVPGQGYWPKGHPLPGKLV